MKRSLLATLALGATLTLTACSGSDDSDGSDAEPQPSDSTSDKPIASPTSSPSTGSSTRATAWPAYAPDDYTYQLEVLCFCPQLGTVQVQVTNGEVVTAKSLTGRLKGKPAPEFVQLTINDIIDRANDPAVDEAKVDWPKGQSYPSSVRIDTLKGATDDEVTYVIRRVRVTAE